MTDDPIDGKYMRCLDETPPRGLTSHKELCKFLTDCVACVQTTYGCVWCGKSCAHEVCQATAHSSKVQEIVNLEMCNAQTGIECYQLHTCQACLSDPQCIWSWSNGPDRCKPLTDIMVVSTNNINAFFLINLKG